MLMLERTAEAFLEAGETLPPSVMEVVAFFATRRLFARFTRNRVMPQGCRDAASKRLRNGQRGISPSDELKSLAGTYRDKDRSDVIFFCHIPADHRFDLRKIRVALNAPTRPTWLSQEGCERLGIGFGRVNPFAVQNVVHLFERSLLNKPGTMMTNACDRTFAVEFYPAEVIAAINGAVVADVVEEGTSA